MSRPGAGTGLTPSGWAAAAGGCLLLAAGLAAGYPTLASLGAAGLAAVGGALGFVAVRPRLRATRTVEPARVTVGEHAHGRIELTNTGRVPAPPFEAVDQVDGAAVRVPAPPLRPGGHAVLTYEVPAHRRGPVRVGPVVLHRTDPFGLACRRAPLAAAVWLWVRPRIHPIRPIPVGVALDFEGRLTDKAGSTAFSALRGYQPGDDPRVIHWRSTARLGTLVVRERVDTSEPVVTIVVDTRADRYDPESFEGAVEFAASVSVAFQRIGRPVSLAAVGEDRAAVALAGGRDVLDRLTALRPAATAGLAAVLELIDRSPGGGCLVLVTGAAPGAAPGPPPGLAPAVAHRRRRFSDVVVAQIGPDQHPGVLRQSGVVLLGARSGAEAAALFNRLGTPGAVPAQAEAGAQRR